MLPALLVPLLVQGRHKGKGLRTPEAPGRADTTRHSSGVPGTPAICRWCMHVHTGHRLEVGGLLGMPILPSGCLAPVCIGPEWLASAHPTPFLAAWPPMCVGPEQPGGGNTHCITVTPGGVLPSPQPPLSG